MKTRLLGLAVVLVAMGILVNALAVTKADVKTNALSFDIVNTSSALIGLKSGDNQDKDVSFVATGGTSGKLASITIATGLQPGSSYVFQDAFQIVNNSANTNGVTVSLTDVTTVAGVTVKFFNSTDSTRTAFSTADLTTTTKTVNLGMEITVDDSASVPAKPTFSFTVHADKKP